VEGYVSATSNGGVAYAFNMLYLFIVFDWLQCRRFFTSVEFVFEWINTTVIVKFTCTMILIFLQCFDTSLAKGRAY